MGSWGWGGGRGGEGVVKGVEGCRRGGWVFGVGGLLFIVDTKSRPQMTPSPSAWRTLAATPWMTRGEIGGGEWGGGGR